MGYRHSLGGTTWVFEDLRTLLAKATPRKSGDELAGIAAKNDVERAAARWALAEVPLSHLLEEPALPYEKDEVTRVILDSHDATAFAPVRSMTVGDLRDYLRSEQANSETLAELAPGLVPEMAAAVCKLMRNQDLVAVARKCRVVSRFRTTVGLAGRLSTRLQPNHPTDDPRGILASILDGLLYGSGDAVIGINPATDSVDSTCTLLEMLERLRTRFAIPTQACVLSHVTTQMQALQRGAPVDLMFQSIGGTADTLKSFGVTVSMLDEAQEMARSLGRGTIGNQVMYFETGQGSSLSAGAHAGVDQQTLETRAYGLARRYHPFLVNTVVGFIGPEYLYDGRQILRAGLEDHFTGKLLGLPMGVDVCYTNHADADQDDMDILITILATAGVNYLMGVPGADDVMLHYQTTSFHDAAYLRETLGLRPAPEFETWLQTMQILDERGALKPTSAGHPLLSATGMEMKT